VAKIYKIGFTRPTLQREAVLTAQLYLESRAWKEVWTEVSRDNLYQTRTARAGEVTFGELRKRLSLLNDEQIELLAADYTQDVRQLVWISICKQYPFVGDFTLEVVTPAFQSGRYEVNYDDYSYFFHNKADWHPELEKVSDKTRSNARQWIFQMMRQCELLTDDNKLIPQMVSSAIQNCSPESDLSFIPGAIRL
jgi:hypothetical protein